MIRVRTIFGVTIVTGTDWELETLKGLSGITLRPGDKLTLLPAKHHIQRNPRPPLLKRMEEGQDE